MTYHYENRREFNSLQGEILTAVTTGKENGNDSVTFHTADGKAYRLTLIQDCCEAVDLVDGPDTWDDILNEPLLLAEEREQDSTATDHGSQTWTFYTLRTNKGTVDMRWKGESNGYYSERVDFYLLP